MKPGTSYEQLTRDIFEEILNDKSVQTIEVKHNVILQGKSTNHQIDVYWEFTVGGVTYKTIVQAKDWSNPVDQGELLKFKAILDDIPDQPRGVFVTRTGYQSGAQAVAKTNGILLYELREPNHDELDGRFRKVILTINGFFPKTELLGVLVDKDWFAATVSDQNLTAADEAEIEIIGSTDEIQVLDESGQAYMSLYELVGRGLELDFKEMPATEKEVYVDRQSFVRTSSTKVPNLKIKGIKARYWITMASETTEFVREDFPEYILKNILDDRSFLFSRDMKKVDP